MTNTTHPPKESVRKYLEQRTHQEEPPPTLEEIRRMLGWYLMPATSQKPNATTKSSVAVEGGDPV